MFPMKYARIALLSVVFLGVAAVAPPGICAFHYIPHPYTVPGTGIQGQNIQLTMDSISVGQLQAIFKQFPGISNFNFQFPNQTNWSTSPAAVQDIVGNMQQKAQSMGLQDKLPDLAFSSLANAGVKGDMLQLAIGSLKDGNGQQAVNDMLNKLRSGDLSSISSYLDVLPDWMKNIIMMIFNAVYTAFDFVQSKMQAAYKAAR